MDPQDVPREEFREWAERNGYEVGEVPNGETLVAKSGHWEVHLTKFGNVRVEHRKHLGGEKGELSFGEKQLTVIDEHGTEYRISPGRYPVP